MLCKEIHLPAVVSLASRPGPDVPTRMANGAVLPDSCYNPFDEVAPRDTFKKAAKQIAECVGALLGLPLDDAVRKVLIINYTTIKPGSRMDVDEQMRQGNFCGFIVHTERDVILAGLRPDLASRAFHKVADSCGAAFVSEEAPRMTELITAAALRAASTHSIYDPYTAGYGYSCGQAQGLNTRPSAEFLSRAIVRGGPTSLHFRNHGEGSSIGSSRSALRRQMVDSAAKVSKYYRKTWLTNNRPRVTEAFRTKSEWVRAPFVLNRSLPLATDREGVRLATWETTLRGVEERLMLSVFGSLPNITWARILGQVLHNAEGYMGPFDVEHYRGWAAANWSHAHGVGPGRLGCPWRDGASRILPKGACGTAVEKPMHDDDNGVISLSCWTAVTEADTPTNLVFLINGGEVMLGASASRWVLFMGYLPHETRPVNPRRPGTTTRVHHSAFVKPEAEHLAAQVLSKLPCTANGGPWSMAAVRRLRQEAFSEHNCKAILACAAEDALTKAAADALAEE